MNKNIDFNSLSTKTFDQLEALDFRMFSDKADNNGKILMLIPYKYYNDMPNGFVVECINGSIVKYKKSAKPNEDGYVDDDYRFGLLAYGIRVSR